eukprot:9140515-Ditylum_brightwellii.AAC.1
MAESDEAVDKNNAITIAIRMVVQDRNKQIGDIFHCSKPTDWTPTPMYVPVSATALDGTQTWQSTGCSRIVGELILYRDGTFQTYLETLDAWESLLLHDV